MIRLAVLFLFLFVSCGEKAEYEKPLKYKVDYLLSKKEQFCPNCLTNNRQEARSLKVDVGASKKVLLELKNCCGKKIAPYSSARIREDDKHHYCYYFNELDFQSNTQYYIVVDGKRENKIS